MYEFNTQLQKANFNFKIRSQLPPACMEQHTALTAINYTDTERHVEKYPVCKWHFWVRTFFQITLILIVKEIILL